MIDRWIYRVVYAYRRLVLRGRALPSIQTSIGQRLPSWIVHVISIGCTCACVGLAASRTHTPTALAVAVVAALCLWTAISPGYGPVVLMLLVTAMFALGSSSAPFDPMCAPIIALAWLAWRFTMVSSIVGWRGLVQISTLLGWRDLVILAATAVLYMVALLVHGTGTWWTTVLGGIALVVLVVIIRGVHGAAEPNG